MEAETNLYRNIWTNIYLHKYIYEYQWGCVTENGTIV